MNEVKLVKMLKFDKLTIPQVVGKLLLFIIVKKQLLIRTDQNLMLSCICNKSIL